MISTVLTTINDTISSLKTKINACWTAITNKGISVSSSVTKNLTNLPTYIGKLKNPTGTLNITTNVSNKDVTNYAAVNVNVPQPSGNIDITENKTYDVSKYATANVNVPTTGGGITPSGTLSIHTNGKRDVTNYAYVDVNVPLLPTAHSGETAQAIEVWRHLYSGDPSIWDPSQPFQIEVDERCTNGMSDIYSGSEVVMIGNLFLDSYQCEINSGITSNNGRLSTNFFGFPNCEKLMHIDRIYGNDMTPDNNYIPLTVPYQWFSGCPNIWDNMDTLFYWGGIYAWGASYDELIAGYGTELTYDPEYGLPGINLSHLLLHPLCIYKFVDNLADLVRLGKVSEGGILYNIWINQYNYEIFGSNDLGGSVKSGLTWNDVMKKASDKGWGIVSV